jgi:predicted transglutaminase-like cysteine proteinase
MKKRSLCFVSAFAFLMVFYGCTGEESSVDEIPHYTELIENWQAREATCDTVETERQPTKYFDNDIRHLIAELEIDYVSEGGNNYWQTSCESIASGGGDCEDMAILAYRAIMDSSLVNYHDMDVRIRVLDVADSSKNHVVTVIYYQENVYYIDNLNLSSESNEDRVVIEFDAETIF